MAWRVVRKQEQNSDNNAATNSENNAENQQNNDMGVKKRKKRVIIPIVIVALLCVVALVWALPYLPLTPRQQAPEGYKGVVELWNVEAFEGGIGSREAWLINKAAKYEKSNVGLFVHVTSLTVDQLQDKLSNGETFDMITFSRGAGALVQQYLSPISEGVGFVKENFLISAQVDGKQYAMPLYTGAYCLFARAEQCVAEQLLQNALTHTYTRTVGKNKVELQPLICGFTPYNSPLSALAMSGGHGKATKIDENTTQYQAYEQFVANRTAVTLLGTQRDIYRLSQRETNGKIEQLAFLPLGGYTDLVQYIGVSNVAEDKTAVCEQFISYLLSETTQQTLTSISMFSVLDTAFYTADRYADCERLLPMAYVPNVFGNADAVTRQRETALATLNM